MLRTIGETVRSSLRKSDLACRIGGDEFAVLLPETPLEGGLTAAEHLRERVAGLQFTAPGGKTFRTSVSIGVVSFPRDAQTLSELLASVDVSLYHAKVLGKNTVTSIDAAQGTVERTRAMRTHIEALRQALEEDRVVPYFQPILDCRGGRLYGYEALARLVEMDGQIKPAASFVPIIEKYGLAHDLDQRILEKTLEEKARYLRAGGPPAKLFINLCPQETQGGGILEFAEDLCTRLGVPPACLVFEISEREAIGDASRMRAFLTQLRQQGFAFALDDFGSGYKSFHSLRDLRFEYVKLDGTFVRDIVASGIDLALVRNLSHLCDDLGIRTIAKCVESAGILERLRELGVDYAQGYHFGLPQPHMGIHE